MKSELRIKKWGIAAVVLISSFILHPSSFSQVSYSRINSLPVRNSPQATDSIPASDSAGVTWRIPFSKFGGGGSGNALTSQPLSQFAATTSLQLAGVITNETGSGALVFGTSPVLITPSLGTPTVIHLNNGDLLPAAGIGSGIIDQARLGTGSDGSGTHALFDDQTYKIITGGGDALVANPLSQFAATTSAQLAGVMTDETGSGALVFGSGPTISNPTFTGGGAFGTPASINLANAIALPLGSITGFPFGMASFLAAPSSANLAATLTDENGSGKVIFAAGTLSIAAGKTATFSNTVLFAGTDGSTVTFGAGGTVVYTNSSAFITGQTADTTPDPAADYILSYDASATSLKKVKISDLFATASITGVTDPTSGFTATFDASGLTANRQMKFADGASVSVIPQVAVGETYVSGITSAGVVTTQAKNAAAAAPPTIASASTISPTAWITKVSGTTTINTISVPGTMSATGGQITLIPTGAWATGTSGNIAIASSADTSRPLILTYDSGAAKWYPNYTNALNATNLTSGTVPDARFPATLPAASGVNLTALNATNLASGTIPDARYSSSGLPTAVVAHKASDSNLVATSLTFYVKSVSVLTSGTPADIATITLPAGVTRWRVTGSGAGNARSTIVSETQAGTMAAGTMAMFDAASGGGTQQLATTAPSATSGPSSVGWLSSQGLGANLSTSTTLVIRQMANSANSGTCSFYISVLLIP